MLAEINTLRKCNDVKQYVKLHFMKYEPARDSFKKKSSFSKLICATTALGKKKMYNTFDGTYKCSFGDG